MNSDDYKVLKEVLDEMYQERNELDKEIDNNLAVIKSADYYTKSVTDKENSDFKVFSPRSVESIYKDELSKAKNEKEEYEKVNMNLNHCRNVLSSRIDKLESLTNRNEADSVQSKLQVINIQEADRHRIARDLHDVTLQNLTYLIHKIELSGMFIDQDPIRAKLELSVVTKNIKETIDEIRNIIFDLRPMTFDDLGFKTSLERLISKINDKSQYVVDMDIENVSCENNLLLVNIYRIVKECIFNIVKHAEATKIFFHCKSVDNIYVIDIRDNGKGFDKTLIDEKKNNHFGLSLMNERITLLGGKIDLKSKLGKGTSIKIEIPLI